ncbi:hypothetical protein DDE82_006798 [Stemphylium lycopersici]|uniref:5'-3' DNA helicase ZGRF1-like N-terminal domain-containing protein n=1 Tax=Stemphylium lycopersici TaxID=183478 RepID=A0A364N501_STELY|nr:hypothetical protein TW65_97119 [Stemphylium lycopersici]RAR01008.1 hypothetical protein DDE82_006798 [Stemphylium lycopersici]RAR12175.1 hypothetical protein DDE83_004180 [Stemphylium lycopersici]
MTAPLRNTQHASAIAAIAASQNSAPVAEFRCLFTQDLRRKQKRWQDGYLKFHTFNNRVMVYDQARNFLGDTYYKHSNELQEGDELNLNNGALVEVSEPMGITHTDLAPILDKKAKEQPPRPGAPSQPKPFQTPSAVAPANPQRNASQLRHKSLNTLLGTPKGPIGKAQPIKSPYEARKEKENELAPGRAPKRQKTCPAPPVWRASSPVQEESPIAKKDPPPIPKTADTKNARRPAKFIPPSATVITIDSEPDPHPAYLSDVTLPSTPPKVAKKRIERAAKTSAPQPVVPPQAPAKTPKIPKGKVPVPSVRALETPKRPAPPSSPPVSASNRLSNIEYALHSANVPPKEPSPPPPPPPPEPSPPPARKAKSLRLSTGVKRGKLLCQALPQQDARTNEPRMTNTKVRARTVSRVASKEPSSAVSQNNNPNTAKLPSKGKRKGADPDDVAPKRPRVSKSPPLPSPSLLEDPEVIHGLMDQQLLIPSPPMQPHLASSPPIESATNSEAAVTKNATNKTLQTNVPVAKPQYSLPKTTARKAPAEEKAENPNPAAKVSPPPPASIHVSPAHIEVSGIQSRTASTSPRKVPLSTGRLPKQHTKRSKKQSSPTSPKPDVPPPAPHNESAPLPPHPLRADKNGALMSTTELAALLQKSKNLAKALADPIEDEGNANTSGTSPTRSFRRVRSENDAPIPSAAEAWEKRNLPKLFNNVTDVAEEPAAAVTAEEAKKKKGSGLGALIRRTDPRRKFKRTQSLQADTNAAQPVTEEVELPSPIVDRDIGPWSTEASDLFDWRPQGRGSNIE